MGNDLYIPLTFMFCDLRTHPMWQLKTAKGTADRFLSVFILVQFWNQVEENSSWNSSPDNTLRTRVWFWELEFNLVLYALWFCKPKSLQRTRNHPRLRQNWKVFLIYKVFILTTIGTSFALFFWLGMAPNRSEGPMIDPKLPILGQIWPFSRVNA